MLLPKLYASLKPLSIIICGVGKSRVEARETQQKLTKAEEKFLVEWITRLTDMISYGTCGTWRKKIRRRRNYEIVNRSIIILDIYWVQQSISCHSQLRTVCLVLLKSIALGMLRETWLLIFRRVWRNMKLHLRTCRPTIWMKLVIPFLWG